MANSNSLLKQIAKKLADKSDNEMIFELYSTNKDGGGTDHKGKKYGPEEWAELMKKLQKESDQGKSQHIKIEPEEGAYYGEE